MSSAGDSDSDSSQSNVKDSSVHYIQAVHGKAPSKLLEYILLTKIQESMYWKQHCAYLNAESIVDKVIELNSIGGTLGANKMPHAFLCLITKLLDIQPNKEILSYYINQTHFKYLRLLAALYVRMTANSADVYTILEPLYADRRKILFQTTSGQYEIKYIDEIIELLLNQPKVFDIMLPFMNTRLQLESAKKLKPMQAYLTEQQLELLDKLQSETQEISSQPATAQIEEIPPANKPLIETKEPANNANSIAETENTSLAHPVNATEPSSTPKITETPPSPYPTEPRLLPHAARRDYSPGRDMQDYSPRRRSRIRSVSLSRSESSRSRSRSPDSAGSREESQKPQQKKKDKKHKKHKKHKKSKSTKKSRSRSPSKKKYDLI
jgi:pre-mRNA-splicing factor 38A